MKMIKVTIMGIDTELPEFRACKHCGKEDCRLGGVFYPEYCNACKGSEWYETHLKEQSLQRKKHSGIDDAFKANKPAGIYEGRGRQVVVNHKGDIIDNVPYKPRPAGRKDWKL